MYILKAQSIFPNGESRNEDLVTVTGKTKKEVKATFSRVHGFLFKNSWVYSIEKI